jgi:hypothetical protein
VAGCRDPFLEKGPDTFSTNRKRISCKERKQFARTVRAYEQEQEEQRRTAAGLRLSQREALSRALVRHGVLAFTSTTVPAPYPTRRRRGPPHSSR